MMNDLLLGTGAVALVCLIWYVVEAFRADWSEA